MILHIHTIFVLGKQQLKIIQIDKRCQSVHPKIVI